MPTLEDGSTIQTPTPVAPNGGNENISPGDNSWGDFLPTTTPVAGQLNSPAGKDLSIAPLPTNEQATPIDYFQQTTNNDDLSASLPPASGQNNENSFNLDGQGGELAFAASADLGTGSDFSGAAGEIPPFVSGKGKKLRVRRDGGKWRAIVWEFFWYISCKDQDDCLKI